MGKEVRYKRLEEEEPNVEESKGRVSDEEVESVMKLLVTYQKARAEGIAPPNPELDVRPPFHYQSVWIFRRFHCLIFFMIPVSRQR